MPFAAPAVNGSDVSRSVLAASVRAAGEQESAARERCALAPPCRRAALTSASRVRLAPN